MKTPFSWRLLTVRTKPQLGIDVVCGMEIDRAASKFRVRYHNETYYFCSANCRQHFENNPDRYVGDK